MSEADSAGERHAPGDSRVGQRPAELGIAFVMIFLVLSNTNAVFASNLLQSINPLIFLFWSFLAASITFSILLAVRHGFSALVIRRNWAIPLLMVNSTTALTWFGYYYALRFIAPAVVTAIMGGLGPLSTIAFQRVMHWRSVPSRMYVAATGILLGTGVLAWASVSGQSGIRQISLYASLVGLVAAAIGGIFQALNTMATKRLGELGLTASQIMTHRFYLLIAVAATLSLAGPGLSPGSPSRVGYLAIATVLGVIAPLWPLQRGILLSEPATVAVLLACSPVITYLFQGFDSRLHWSGFSAAGCAIMVLFTVYGTRLMYGSSRAQPGTSVASSIPAEITKNSD
jgi:drug/metabolite transporter (DMT)-like permease